MENKTENTCCNCTWCIRENGGGPTESVCRNPQSLNYGQVVCP